MRLIVTLSTLLAILAVSCEEPVLPEATAPADPCQHEGIVMVNDCGTYLRLYDGRAIFVTNDVLNEYTEGTQLIVGFNIVSPNTRTTYSTSGGNCSGGCGNNHNNDHTQEEENYMEDCMTSNGIQQGRIYCVRMIPEETK